ncbi:MAG TPA: hypothetical protein VF407_25280, partial [Polyangiaceae bacterium]
MKTSRLVASLTAALAVPACFARQIDSSSAGATADHGSEAGPSGNDGVPSGEPPALDPPAGPNDIVGSLWDGLGNRANGASIRVDGAAVATDAWGRFVVRDAPPTYSLVVLGDAPHSGASVFPAATTRTPRVTITSSHIDQPQLASLNVVAPSLSQPDAKLITYVYDPTGYFSVQFDGPSSAIEIKPPNASETVTAYEIEYVQPDSNAPPTAFLRWAKQDGLVMTPGQTTTFTPTMQALTSPAQTVTTHPTTGPGMTVYEAYPYIAPRGATQPPSLFNTWGILTAPAEFSFV